MSAEKITLKIRRLVNKVLKSPTDDIDVPVLDEPLPEVRIRPPILLRLEDGEIEQETVPQFMTYGWKFGYTHYLTSIIDEIYDAAGADKSFKAQTTRILIEKKFSLDQPMKVYVKAAQMFESDHYELQGPVYAAMFLPSGYTVYDGSAICEMTGGPSEIFLRLIKKIALRLHCRITSIETAADGAVLVLFSPWNSLATFFDLLPLPEASDGIVDDTNGSMENG
jgi:hypothetical protein